MKEKEIVKFIVKDESNVRREFSSKPALLLYAITHLFKQGSLSENSKSDAKGLVFTKDERLYSILNDLTPNKVWEERSVFSRIESRIVQLVQQQSDVEQENQNVQVQGIPSQQAYESNKTSESSSPNILNMKSSASSNSKSLSTKQLSRAGWVKPALSVPEQRLKAKITMISNEQAQSNQHSQ